MRLFDILVCRRFRQKKFDFANQRDRSNIFLSDSTHERLIKKVNEIDIHQIIVFNKRNGTAHSCDGQTSHATRKVFVPTRKFYSATRQIHTRRGNFTTRRANFSTRRGNFIRDAATLQRDAAISHATRQLYNATRQFIKIF